MMIPSSEFFLVQERIILKILTTTSKIVDGQTDTNFCIPSTVLYTFYYVYLHCIAMEYTIFGIEVLILSWHLCTKI